MLSLHARLRSRVIQTIAAKLAGVVFVCTALPTFAGAVSPISGLLTPESVVQAADGRVYVSEINGFGTDGDGQIRVIQQGQSSVLVKGLNDPKGLAFFDHYLYIADKTQVLRVDLQQQPAKAEIFVAASAFPKVPQFLNDLAFDAKGNLYLSDSGDILGTGKGGAIYKISPQRQLQLLIDGAMDTRVLAPNGLLPDATGEQLYWVDFTSGILYLLNTSNKRMVEVANGFGGGDGIVKTSDGSVYVSDWKNGRVFHVSQSGKVSLIKQGYQSAADIALGVDGRSLLVPDMKAGLLDVLTLP